ncbi:hypothetical protein BpHYR1_014647, partial [Brachionus plicatilis]
LKNSEHIAVATRKANNNEHSINIFDQKWSICELIYCVTATSVPSENLFSNAGLVQNDQRNWMESAALNITLKFKNFKL